VEQISGIAMQENRVTITAKQKANREYDASKITQRKGILISKRDTGSFSCFVGNVDVFSKTFSLTILYVTEFTDEQRRAEYSLWTEIGEIDVDVNWRTG
jgi:hypothetical protein